LQQIAKSLRSGASVCERQPREMPERDDAGPTLELVPESKLADDAAGARVPNPQHQAGHGGVRYSTNATLFDGGAGEPADKGSGHWPEKIRFRYTLGTLCARYALRHFETTRNQDSDLNANKCGIYEESGDSARDKAFYFVSPRNPWGARGRKFESSRPDQLNQRLMEERFSGRRAQVQREVQVISFSAADLVQLLQFPNEALTVEHKNWLDISVNPRAKLAKAAIALTGREQILGRDRGTGRPNAH